jgi:hypothetical protein
LLSVTYFGLLAPYLLRLCRRPSTPMAYVMPNVGIHEQLSTKDIDPSPFTLKIVNDRPRLIRLNTSAPPLSTVALARGRSAITKAPNRGKKVISDRMPKFSNSNAPSKLL